MEEARRLHQAIGLLNLKAVEAKWGTTPLKHVENPRSRALFLRWHDSLAEVQPRAADNKLAALARVFSWSYNRGLIAHNPIATFERAYGSTRAELIWLPDHVSAFERAAAPELQLALMLGLHTASGRATCSSCRGAPTTGKLSSCDRVGQEARQGGAAALDTVHRCTQGSA